MRRNEGRRFYIPLYFLFPHDPGGHARGEIFPSRRKRCSDSKLRYPIHYVTSGDESDPGAFGEESQPALCPKTCRSVRKFHMAYHNSILSPRWQVDIWGKVFQMDFSPADGIQANPAVQARDGWMEGPGEAQRPIPERMSRWLLHEWIWIFLIGYGLFVGLPWLAPVFMHLGWERPARWLYDLYSLFCHQLPQRSLFLFGLKPMYSLSEIRQAWPYEDPLLLRAFIGDPVFGYKVAWSDRMISMYTSLWAATLLYAVSGRRWRPIPVGIFLLLVFPMALDGTTHFINDLLYGIGERGFRYDNAWLVMLTGGRLPSWFYVGDALGSFNSWMRWITGVLFGAGLGGLALPYVETAIQAALGDRKHGTWSSSAP